MSTRDTVEPALTPRQWEHWERQGYHFDTPFFLEAGSHARAAAALYGEPFGFTREDVNRLRAAAKREVRKSIDMESVGANERARAFSDLADRIEALLPPEEGP